jgi:S-adenosylmethionine-dependent methyltransferase
LNEAEQGFTTAYFTGVEEAKALMNSFDLEELAFAGIENILGSKESEIMASPQYSKWIDIAYALSQDAKVYGTSQHFLYIGKK